MLYVQSRKSLKVRREKKLISLPSAKKHSAKKGGLPSAKKNTRLHMQAWQVLFNFRNYL